MAGEAPHSAGGIRLLSDLVRDQIAAGEVIERPASVVKELVENALDAGAERIRIELEEGGVKRTCVTDDGCGMGPDDLLLAFASHATSKLCEPGDLEHIATLGFRGEALASIGSVSRCSLRSRRAADEVGARVEDVGGRLGPVVEAGGAAGTCVDVRDLFFNTPVRRRFLKRASTELARCLDAVQRLALAQMGVGFVVLHDGRRVLDVEPEMDLRARVRRVFGAELATRLEPVEGADGATRLAGLVAPPRLSRTDTSRQMWFLNGRPLRDRLLTRALKDAYRGFLVEGRQPVAFLSLAMDPAGVDVNVHPTKAEVRFRDGRRLFGFVIGTVREAVRRTDMATPGERMLGELSRRGAWGARDAPGQAVLPDPGAAPAEPLEIREVPGRAPVHEAPPSGWEARDELRGPFLQIDRTYLVRALPDGFEIVDQHALHERLTFEELRRELRRGAIEVQRLLVPEVVEVDRSRVGLLDEHGEAARRVGIHLSVFGPTAIAVNGLPARLVRPDAEGIVRDLFEIIERTGQSPDAEEIVEEVLHRAACRSSVMAGDELGEDEIRSLLERAAALESDQTCPHARPTRVRFSLEDLEKAFHRR